MLTIIITKLINSYYNNAILANCNNWVEGLISAVATFSVTRGVHTSVARGVHISSHSDGNSFPVIFSLFPAKPKFRFLVFATFSQSWSFCDFFSIKFFPTEGRPLQLGSSLHPDAPPVTFMLILSETHCYPRLLF